jgi:pimeloyl-ACP methyl ester carboxylesterase
LYLYLHGFASGPRSRKARFLAEKFATAGLELVIPDFNAGGFSDFTITRQLRQVASHCREAASPLTLIGSSLGGWAALLLAQEQITVDRLVLMAPALGFPSLWLERLGAAALEHWQQAQALPVYHYIEKQQVPLKYEFVTDAQQYLQHNFDRPLPTLILHGQHDEVVPIEVSRTFSAAHPWTKLIELDSDHSLGNVLAPIWQEISQFCQLDAQSNHSHPR